MSAYCKKHEYWMNGDLGKCYVCLRELEEENARLKVQVEELSKIRDTAPTDVVDSIQWDEGHPLDPDRQNAAHYVTVHPLSTADVEHYVEEIALMTNKAEKERVKAAQLILVAHHQFMRATIERLKGTNSWLALCNNTLPQGVMESLLKERNELAARNADLEYDNEGLHKAVAGIWDALGIKHYTGKSIVEHVQIALDALQNQSEGLKSKVRALEAAYETCHREHMRLLKESER